MFHYYSFVLILAMIVSFSDTMLTFYRQTCKVSDT